MKEALLRTSVIMPLIFLLIPILSDAQQWVIIANEQQIASETSSFTNIVTVLDGAITVPYVVYTESGIAKVKKFDGDNWIAVGDNVSPGAATHTRIYADDNSKLYVTYVDAANGNRLAIKTFDEATQLWQPLNNDPSNLYISADTFRLAMVAHPEYDDRYWRFVKDLVVVGANGNGKIRRIDSAVWLISTSGRQADVSYRIQLPSSPPFRAAGAFFDFQLYSAIP